MVQITYLLNNSDICSSLANIWTSHSLESMKKLFKRDLCAHHVLRKTWHPVSDQGHPLAWALAHTRSYWSFPLLMSYLIHFRACLAPYLPSPCPCFTFHLWTYYSFFPQELSWFSKYRFFFSRPTLIFLVTTVPALVGTCSTVSVFHNSALHRGLSTSF